jgi:hypothetical protein
MLKDKFINLGDTVINTDHIVSAIFYDDGSVRLYNTLVNEHNSANPGFWDYDGELAVKLRSFLEKNSQAI